MVKFDNDELFRRVDEVLYYIWDPIGVSNEPFARHEYHSYVREVLRLVEENDDIGPISSYLSYIAGNYMGISSEKKKCDYAAEILLKHKKAVKQGLA